MILFKVERCCRFLLLYIFFSLLFQLRYFLSLKHTLKWVYSLRTLFVLLFVVQLFRLALLFFFFPVTRQHSVNRKQTQRVPADRIRYRHIRVRTTTTRLLWRVWVRNECSQYSALNVVGAIFVVDVSVFVCVCDSCLKRMMVRSDFKCLFCAIRSNDFWIENVYVFLIYLMVNSQFRFSTDGKIQ